VQNQSVALNLRVLTNRAQACRLQMVSLPRQEKSLGGSSECIPQSVREPEVIPTARPTYRSRSSLDERLGDYP